MTILVNDPAAEAAWEEAFRLGVCVGNASDSVARYVYAYDAAVTFDGKLIIRRCGKCVPLHPIGQSGVCDLPVVYWFPGDGELQAELTANGGSAFLVSPPLRYDSESPPKVRGILERPIPTWSAHEAIRVATYLSS